MHNERITHLTNSSNKKGKYVLYWMQKSQRVAYNHALSYAIEVANENMLPLVVVFVVTTTFLDANARHYTFMFEGLYEVKAKLEDLGITFVLKTGTFETVIPDLAREAHAVIFDFGYLRDERQWRRNVLDAIKQQSLPVKVTLIESDLIIPVRSAYDKVAYGAYVLRPHIMKKIAFFDDYTPLHELKNKGLLPIKSDYDINQIETLLAHLGINQTVGQSPYFKGGYTAAKEHLNTFMNDKLRHYLLRSDPSLKIQSYLSPYLHFGQISPLEIYREIITSPYLEEKEQFIEQLLVRRELAFNYVYYNKDYDQFGKMTEPWAYLTMETHQHDPRDPLYSDNDIEMGLTNDIYFNAAMDEMRITGFMANYMRMYWAKKIVTWTASYKHAYELIVTLNNRYFLDGRDPNSYVNIAWIFGKMDRPWPERAIFGTLRSMNESGLKKKFKIDTYVAQIDQLRKNDRK